MNVSTACPADHPLMIAWKAYQATEDFANSKRWALALYTSRQGAEPATPHADNVADVPIDATVNVVDAEHRECLVMGSLWAAFMAGFGAAGGRVTA